MNEPHENDENQINDPRTENELKKIKLALEHGMDFSKSFSNSDLPPEIEGQFLDYVQQWEDEYAKRKTILVYDLCNKPQFRPVAEIPDEEISAELEKISDILNNASVSIDTICDVEERELYRFITEELFNLETDDIRIPGMMHCFIYEEFHPNHEYDIKNRCTELVEHITDKDKNSDSEPWGLANDVWCGGISFSKEDLNKKLINFRDSFSTFTMHEFEYTTVHINNEKNEAEAIADIHYSGVIDGSNDTLEFKGRCKFMLKCEYDWWIIYNFEIPGVVV